VKRSRSLEGIATELQSSVDEYPCTVDELKASGDEFRTFLDKHQTIVDKHQTTADRLWIIVDGQVVRWHKFQGAVDISKNFVDECRYASLEREDSAYQFGTPAYPFGLKQSVKRFKAGNS
jgi:hypothetical protein